MYLMNDSFFHIQQFTFYK